MTEEDARTRWCPFARFASFDAGVNRSASAIPERARCLASGCMAWRWMMPSDITDDSDGFCGLAGSWYGAGHSPPLK